MNAIKSIQVDWMEGWGNDPHFIVEMEKPVESHFPSMFSKVWTRFADGMHVAEHTDSPLVSYFYSDGKPCDGFGGAVFKGMLKDGTPFEYKGAWSSRAACVNALDYKTKVVDVTIGMRACAINARDFVDFFKANRENLDFGLAWVDVGDRELICLPTYRGELKQTSPATYRIVWHV